MMPELAQYDLDDARADLAHGDRSPVSAMDRPLCYHAYLEIVGFARDRKRESERERERAASRARAGRVLELRQSAETRIYIYIYMCIICIYIYMHIRVYVRKWYIVV